MNPFGYRPVPKPNRKRTKRSTDFSPATRKAIIERDGGCCVRCGQRGQHIHHCNFRSEHTPDVNQKRNGLLVCQSCHAFAHGSREGREWFLRYKAEKLDEKGDRIND